MKDVQATGEALSHQKRTFHNFRKFHHFFYFLGQYFDLLDPDLANQNQWIRISKTGYKNSKMRG